MLLARNASFTKSLQFVDQCQSFHHIIHVQQLHPTKIQNSKYKMPQPRLILNLWLKCCLNFTVFYFFLVTMLVFFFAFYLECNSRIFLLFHVWRYPQRKQVITCHWYFFYHLVSWTHVFNHIPIVFHIDSITFLYQLSNAQQNIFYTFDIIDIKHNISLPLFGQNINSTFSQNNDLDIISKCDISLK